MKVLFYREDPRLREQEWGNFQVGFVTSRHKLVYTFLIVRILQRLILQCKTGEKLELFIIALPLVKGNTIID